MNLHPFYLIFLLLPITICKSFSDILIENHPYIATLLYLKPVKNELHIEIQAETILITLKYSLSAKVVLRQFQGVKIQDLSLSAGYSDVRHSEPRKIEALLPYPSSKDLYDALVLVKLVHTIESKIVRPVKLPTSIDAWTMCNDQFAIGRGSAEPKPQSPSGEELKLVKVQLEKCKSKEELDDSVFCLHNSARICSKDVGLAVLCKGTLLALLQPITTRVDFCSDAALATNIAHYMTWFRNVTGVKVAFEASPKHPRIADSLDYYDFPLQNEDEGESTLKWRLEKNPGVTVIFEAAAVDCNLGHFGLVTFCLIVLFFVI